MTMQQHQYQSIQKMTVVFLSPHLGSGRAAKNAIDRPAQQLSPPGARSPANK